MKWHRILLVSALAMTAAATAQTNDFEKQILDAHNRERATLGLKPLTWNATLAAGAKAWAAHLAETGLRAHSKPAERGNTGENIFAGTAGGYTPDEMVGGWLAEKPNFVNGAFPAVVKAGDWHVVGHYSQIVWRNTTEIGCGLATGGGSDIMVCRYNPAGNLVGQVPY